MALKRDAQRKPRKDDPETRHKAEIDRMRAVIAEITAENLELTKDLKLEDLSRVPAETIAAVMHLPHVVLRPIRIALALEAGVVTGGALDSQIPIRCALIDYDSHQDGARTLRLGPVGAARVVDIALGGLSVNMDDVFHGPEDQRWA